MAATTLWTRSNKLNGKMKPTLIWISTLLACIYFVNARSTSPYYSELRALAAPTAENEHPISSLDLWRYILSMDARSRIFPTSYRRTIGSGSDQARKRGGSSSCLFNAGLAHNCDYRDVVGAVNEMNHWGSDLAPGKRKKREVTSRQQQQQQDYERTSDVEQSEEYPVGLLRELIERNRILMERNQRF